LQNNLAFRFLYKHVCVYVCVFSFNKIHKELKGNKRVNLKIMHFSWIYYCQN